MGVRRKSRIKVFLIMARQILMRKIFYWFQCGNCGKNFKYAGN